MNIGPIITNVDKQIDNNFLNEEESEGSVSSDGERETSTIDDITAEVNQFTSHEVDHQLNNRQTESSGM